MVVGVMRILVLMKFLNVKFISVKIGDPLPVLRPLKVTGVNICL
jgi:hypothetical protein